MANSARAHMDIAQTGKPMGVPMVRLADLQDLVNRVKGPVLIPGDSGYEGEVRPFNLNARHTPAVAVGVVDADDVSTTVRWARAHGLTVAVQATGHGATVSFSGGVLISTRRMQSVHIDPERRLARIGAGVKWRAVIDAATPYGLAPLNGSSSDVGAIAYNLGGGLPVMGRTFGWASDLVRELEVVTANGSVVTVSEYENPNLFWAFRTGKPNLGIVTSMTMELLPVSRIYGGSIYWDGQRAVEALVTLAGPGARTPLVIVEIRHLGGALRGAPGVQDAVGARDEPRLRARLRRGRRRLASPSPPESVPSGTG